MKIAAEFTASEWPVLRRRLEAGDAKAWERGVEILRARICGRYLDHSRVLLDRHYSGFAVLAIDCAVVEALEQFRCGVDETPRRKGAEFFQNFLTQTRFTEHFTKDTAKLFYNTIRCGILHQAEAKADSLVKKKAAAFVVKQSATGKGLTVNARRFHEELEAAVNDYEAALLSGEVEFRASFIKKMNYIAREPNDIAGVV
jgi:hypothetical protein